MSPCSNIIHQSKDLLNKKLNHGDVSVPRSRNKWGRSEGQQLLPGAARGNRTWRFSGGKFAGRALGSVSSRKCSHAECGLCFYDNNNLTSYHHIRSIAAFFFISVSYRTVRNRQTRVESRPYDWSFDSSSNDTSPFLIKCRNFELEAHTKKVGEKNTYTLNKAFVLQAAACGLINSLLIVYN